MSACRKLSRLPEPASGPLLRLYQGYLEETGSEVAAAIFALDALRKVSDREATDSTSEFLTVQQAAARYQLGERTVYRLVEDGKIKVHRAGKAIRIRRLDLERHLAGRERLSS
jgi:excisionase family DNA binding protein